MSFRIRGNLLILLKFFKQHLENQVILDNLENLINTGLKSLAPVLRRAGKKSGPIDEAMLFTGLDNNMNTILLLEDNEFIRDNILHMLLFANYDVTAVDNGRAGLEIAMQRPFDLIICDIMMPELDGFGVLEAIRSNPDTADIPFIFLTAKTASHNIRLALDMGADDYLVKPFHEQELLVAVEGCLQKKDSRDIIN